MMAMNESMSEADLFQKGTKMHVSRLRDEYKRKIDR